MTRWTCLSMMLVGLFMVTGLINAENLYIDKVIDGGTIVLNSGDKVGLIGVDAPEMADASGHAAKEFLKKLAEGAQVRLEQEVPNRDKYVSGLAYVYLMDEPVGLFLNEEVIKQGYAKASTKYAFKYSQRFKQLEQEAKAQRRGLWAKVEVGSPEAPFLGTKSPSTSDDKDVQVKGYYRKDGTYVQPYTRSRPSKK